MQGNCGGPSGCSRGVLNVMPWEYIKLGIMWLTGLCPVPPAGTLIRRLNLREPKAAAFSPTHLGVSDHLQEVTQGGVEGVLEQARALL